MANDQKRFEVFVSSTYSDLREARQHVTMTLLECDAFPTGMEIFPATDDDAWTLIRRVIDGCDYYLLVIAGKYGSIDPASGLSYTEMEYDYAVSTGKPVMAFLHGDPRQLLAGQCESTDELRTKLENFREKVKKAKHVKFWKSVDELAGQVSLTYNKFVRLYPAIGWIRSDQGSSVESLKDLLDAKAQIEELQAELKKAKTSAPVGTEDLAQGSDEFAIKYLVTAETRKGGVFRRLESILAKSPTWDELFAAIAPHMLQECEDAELEKKVEGYLLVRYYTDNMTEVLGIAKQQYKMNLVLADVNNPHVGITASDFGTILVQLTALGLIRKSERKRSVSDTGTYWTLTPYGEARTIQLRAIRKPSTETAVPETASGD